MGTLVGKLYQLECEVRCSVGEQASVVIENHDLWHQQLGHLNSQQLYKMVQQNHISGIKLSPRSGESTCEGCIVGKMQRKPFKSVDHKQSSKKLELIHSDICGPFQVDSIGGSRYFATFIDESGERIVKLRTDNGGEYMSTEFQEYLKSKGIQHELTVAYTPQQNGTAERMNRTLPDCNRRKLDDKAEKLRYVGYSKNPKGY